MKRIIITTTALITLLNTTACKKYDDYEPDEYEGKTLLDLNERIKAGGETTIYSENSFAYGTPAPNLTDAEDDLHAIGDQAFDIKFVSSATSPYRGLGPIYNSNSCCHPGEGRASFPTDLTISRGFFMRVSLPGADAHGAPVPVPGFGTQVQNRALTGFQPEGRFHVSFTDSIVTFRDGTKVTLKVPHYNLTGVSATPPANILISPRTSMPIYGLGLLENIPEADILAKEGIECEIIDLRTVRPLDFETIFNSVKKTNRLVILEEAWPFSSVSSEITYQVQEHIFDYLDAPVQRITTTDTPELLKEFLPNAEDVVKAVKKVLYK